MSEKKPKPKPTAARLLRRVLVFSLVTYAVWIAACSALESRLVFPRDMTGPVTSEALIPKQVERVWLTGADGVEVEGWYLPARSSSQGSAVIFFHGNAELIDHNLAMLEDYQSRGISALVMEYRGYGRTGGSPSQRAIVPDAVLFHDWLAKQPGVDPSRIIIHGRSLGTGVAAQLAAQRPPAALILESPFTSIASFASRMFVPQFLVRNSFHTDRALPKLSCPILILHSRQDEIVPFSHAEKLKQLVPTATLVELDGTHNAGLSSQDAYWEAIDRLLQGLASGDHATRR
jgi:fermentation-respiration switch protein FrsA (DUF1100 family)